MIADGLSYTPQQVLASDVDETMQLLTARHLADSRPAAAQHRSGAAGSSSGGGGGGLAPLPELLAAAGEEWQRRAAHIRACLEEGGACDRCAAVVRVLCVTPGCAHLLCVDCASSDRTRCARCAAPYVMQARCVPCSRVAFADSLIVAVATLPNLLEGGGWPGRQTFCHLN